MTADDLPTPTPEGELMRMARLRAMPRLSIKEAARKALISPETWGHVERGYQSLGRGREVRIVVAPADTLARMAHAAHVAPGELEAVGREDAALILREMIPQEVRRRILGPGLGALIPTGPLPVHAPDDLPEEVDWESISRWEKGVWLLSDLPVEQRRAAVAFLRVVRGEA